jgi:NAD(P)H-flavin reductase
MPKFNRRTVPAVSTDHWDRITLDETKCFVCDKPLKGKKGNKKYILIGKRQGVNLYRHEGCDCCSEAWKRKFNGCIWSKNNTTERR